MFDKDIQDTFEGILLSAFKILDEMGLKDDLADLLYYLYNEANLMDSDRFWSVLHQKFSKDVEEKVMTLGQKAQHEAAKVAAQKALHATALRMLDENCSIQLISRVTHLTSEEIKRLAKKAS